MRKTNPLNKPHTQNCRERILEAIADGRIKRWATAGATYRQIAEYLNISYSQFNLIKKDLSELSEVVEHARVAHPAEVTYSMYKLAVGYHEPVTKQHIRRELVNGVVVSETQDIWKDEIYVPPQHQAQTKFLVNYYNMKKRGADGVPDEYVPAPNTYVMEQKQGRFPEMEEALNQLFFGKGKEDDESR